MILNLKELKYLRLLMVWIISICQYEVDINKETLYSEKQMCNVGHVLFGLFYGETLLSHILHIIELIT